jgi:hypothetical protein
MKLSFAYCAVLFLTCLPVNAEHIANWQATLKNPKCDNGGGFFLWDTKQCLFDTGTILIDKKWVRVKEKETRIIFRKSARHDSVGDRLVQVFEGEGLKVRLEIEYLPACDYSSEQCTYRNVFARIVVTRPGKKALHYEGVGYGGS